VAVTRSIWREGASLVIRGRQAPGNIPRLIILYAIYSNIGAAHTHAQRISAMSVWAKRESERAREREM